jgi:hypothetical protein
MITSMDPLGLFLLIAAATAVGLFVGLTAFAFFWGTTLRSWLA